MRSFALAMLAIPGLITILHAQHTDLRSSDFKKADSVAGLYAGHSLHDIKSLSKKLTESLPTDIEKFRAIYTWVCTNVDYDYSLYLRNKSKREKLSGDKLAEWNKTFSRQVFRVLIDKRVTVCTGYAYLVRELSTYAGLSCKVIDGYGRNAQANIGGKGIPNHSWNAVQLKDRWYLCDPTWSSGSIDPNLGNFVRRFDDAYFLADPGLFVRNHYPLDSSMMMLKGKPSLETFINSPLLYTGAFSHQTQPILPKTFVVKATKGDPVAFQFSSRSPMPANRIELRIDGTSIKHPVHSDISDDQAILYSVDHTFSSRGIFVVHVVIGERYAMSYKVRVE